MLVNIIKTLLPSTVNEAQSAIVGGRLITDNIIIAFEVLHWFRCARRSEEQLMAIKLDMSKAYDRVEWKFLEWILIHMNFPCKMVHLLMNCVTTVSYQVLVNKIPTQTLSQK